MNKTPEQIMQIIERNIKGYEEDLNFARDKGSISYVFTLGAFSELEALKKEIEEEA